jgi:hypothetical protein
MELVPFSGIQVLDFEVDLSKLDKPRKRFGVNERVLYPLSYNDTSEGYSNEFSEPYSKIIEEFEEKWLPAPVFRFAGTAQGGYPIFDEGPSTWARMRAKIKTRNSKNEPEKVICQIALDTNIDMDDDPELSGETFYLMPSKSDVWAEKEFGFVASPAQMDWFLDSEVEIDGHWEASQEWVKEWITEVLKDHGLKGGQVEEMRVWAKYFTLIEIFKGANIPNFKLLDTLSNTNRYTPISTDFVLDLGNSRTCGILLEKPGDNQNLKIDSAIPFKIRDFENAEVYREGLMESRVELSQAYFGREELAKRSGRREAFVWPSPVRIGREAQSIQLRAKGTDTASGLSSAKRYLWDQNPVEREWRFSGLNSGALPLIATQTKKLLNEAGDLKLPGEPPAREIRFSRSSFMMFMIAELISHAFAQINNPQERGQRPNSSIPRRLSKIILTIPTATPSREQSILRKRASDALDYVWKILEIPENNRTYKKPELSIEWDEASCSQQVFLFNEILEIYSNQSQSYLNDFGKKRQIDGQLKHCLRVASVDIGGGTTDLMVTTYHCSEGNNVLLPIQEFREGFRIAGDEILFGLIKDAIIPSLANHLMKNGGTKADMALADFFQSVDDAKTNLKANFTNSLLVPSAIKILKQFENPEISSANIVLDNLNDYNDGAFVEQLDLIAQTANLQEWPSGGINVEVPKSLFHSCVDNVLLKVIENIGTALSNFDCDYVLLTGRPSKLAYVRSLFENHFIVSPDRLISLHEYSVGTWYPFREPLSGKIGDPKSTVVVGALLNSVSSFELTNYSFKSEKLKLKSTANFIGEMETTGQIKSSNIIVDNVNEQNKEEFVYEFTNAVHIGARQINDENWTTAPLYRLSVPSAGLEKFTLPLSVTLKRGSDAFDDDDLIPELVREAKKEELQIQEISDQQGRSAPGSLKLSFNTLGRVDNYWLETGLFL